MVRMIRYMTILMIVIPLCAFASTAAAQELFAHDEFSAVLATYVDDTGMVDYADLTEHRDRLDRYVRSLVDLPPGVFDDMAAPEQIAFLINAYNAVTLTAIIDHYPIRAGLFGRLLYPKNSIRQISGVWDELTFTVMGAEMTLDHIEHGILRERFDEPRIHLALVCAAMGCPTLRNEAYTGGQIDRQLDDQMRRFVADPKKFRIDRDRETVYLSSIFKWYGDDFIPSYGTAEGFDGTDREQAVLHFHSRYLDNADRTYLRDGGYRIRYLDYDWSLNEQKY